MGKKNKSVFKKANLFFNLDDKRLYYHFYDPSYMFLCQNIIKASLHLTKKAVDDENLKH